jgi:S1-C subfamily serine protease
MALIVAAVAGAGIGHALWTNSAPNDYAGAVTTPSPGGFYSNPSGNPFYSQFPGTSSGGSSSQGAGAPSDTSAIAAKVDPAIVDIDSNFGYQSASGAGTGIVVSSNGEVLTNNHVIEGATSVTATDIGNGKTYTAKVVGYDPNHDIAVLQLEDASGLQTAQFGNSSNITVAEPVVGIGNAGGGGGTPNAVGGAVTALNQSISAGNELTRSSEQLHGLIEVNAPIQSGDSGGALVNGQGQVIGMDTAASEGFEFSAAAGQGYAIPIDQALATAEQVGLGQGSPTLHIGQTAFMGIQIPSTGSVGGLGSATGGGLSSSGIQIASTIPGEPAARAGLGTGDTITAIDGKSVGSYDQLVNLMLPQHPGDRISVTYTTPSGATHTVSLTLTNGPPT